MTATEELRRLLDECGVEWSNIRNDGSESDYLTEWQFEDNQGKAIAIEWAVGSGLSVEIHRYHLTPEQAIAATLGVREQPPYDELIEVLRRDWDIEASWDGLRRFWYIGLTDDGVRKRDEREATLGRGMLTADDVRDLIERHSDASGGNGRDFHNGAYVAIADELNATLGSCNCSNDCTNSERTETCHIKPWEMERDTGFYDCMECECGYVSYVSDWAEWHFCPNCGRRVVEVDDG